MTDAEFAAASHVFATTPLEHQITMIEGFLAAQQTEPERLRRTRLVVGDHGREPQGRNAGFGRRAPGDPSDAHPPSGYEWPLPSP